MYLFLNGVTHRLTIRSLTPCTPCFPTGTPASYSRENTFNLIIGAFVCVHGYN